MASHIPQIEKVCPVCGVTYLARSKDLGYGCTRKCSTRTVALIQFEKAVEGRDTEVIRLYNAGFGYQAIRTRTGMHLGLVRKICQLAGIVDETRMHAMKARLKTPNWKKTKPLKNDTPAVRRAECNTLAERLIMQSYNDERKSLRRYDERRHWQDHPIRTRGWSAKAAMRHYYKSKSLRTNSYFSRRIRSRVQNAIARSKGAYKAARTRQLIGCSVQSARDHIQSKFKRGMNWKNYGLVWHIDHIVPCASFDLSKPEEQRKCFHFSNLQPLFANENLHKSDRIVPSQPELPIVL